MKVWMNEWKIIRYEGMKSGINEWLEMNEWMKGGTIHDINTGV